MHALRLILGPHLAMTGVMAMVSGTRTGSSALVHRKAMAKEEPLLVRALASHERSSGVASALSSSSGSGHAHGLLVKRM